MSRLSGGSTLKASGISVARKKLRKKLRKKTQEKNREKICGAAKPGVAQTVYAYRAVRSHS